MAGDMRRETAAPMEKAKTRDLYTFRDMPFQFRPPFRDCEAPFSLFLKGGFVGPSVYTVQ